MVTQQESIGKTSGVSGNSAGSKSNTQKDKKNKKNTGNVTTKVTTYKTTGTLITLTTGQDNPVNELTSDLVGGTITITNPHTLVESDLYTTAAGYTLPTTYSSTILNVKNSKEFEVLEPYKITDKNNKTFPVSLKSGNTSITYDTYKTFTEDTVYQRSYANITVGNLRTFSGDVYKAKIYTRDSGTSTDYEQVYENYVIPENELIDESSITGYDNIGFFHTESIIHNNWKSSSTAGDTGQFVTLTNEKLIDSVSISGSVSGINDKIVFRTKEANTLQNGVDYVVRFNTYYYKSLSERRVSNNKIENKNYASLKVYLSGSAITGANGEDDVFVGEVDVTDSMGSEGEILGVVGQFRTAGTGTTKTWLKFELNSGEFHIQDVSIEPFSETNFNPNFFKALVPMPKPVKRGDSYDFLVEFYDCNNNISTTTAEVKGVTFQGPRQVVADGLDGVFEGAMVLGQSVEMYGSNPAYIRSVGYNGFDKTRAGTGDRNGGFLIWSGSIGNGATLNRLTASEAYEGVGIEILDASGSDTYNHSFLQFASNYKNTGNSRFRVQTKEFLLGLSGSGQAGDTYISGSEGNLEISSSNFLLARDGSVTMQGSITATAGGQIGGFTITDKAISTTDFFLSGSSYSGTGFDKTNLVLSSSGFQINSTGQVSASEGIIGGFELGSTVISSSNSNLVLSSSGQITGSTVLFTGGKIGSFNIGETTDATPKGVLFSDSNELVITGSTGVISGSNVHFTGGKIGGFTITDSALTSGNTFFISGSPGTTDNLLKPNLLISSDNFLVSGVGRISASRGQIGGFDITDTFISSSNLILSSTGQITSKDYASNTQGFFLGAVEMADGSVGSFLEVDEARIRGTLKTTVFEKESVNAVGGQLHVANATTITGSATMSADDDTMQVANASGFEAGEIILLKKFNSTGFTTEYMKIHSVSLEEVSDTNFSGSLVVTRSLGTSPTGGTDSGSIGGTGASAQKYTPGQVVVSTGKVGTGYIRLNANPNDQTTPYMDIVERTGTGVYDIDLKARLGDLSGLSQTNLLGVSPVNAGFGLFSENVYLTGGINASFGNIGGWRIENTKITSSDGTTEIISGEGGKIAMGPTLPTDLSSNGIFLSGSGQFNLQSGPSDYIRNGTSGFDIAAQNFTLKGGTTLYMDSSDDNGTITLGTNASSIVHTGTGIYLDGTGKFSFVEDGNNYIQGGDSNFEIAAEDFTLKGGTTMLMDSATNSGVIKLGATATNITETANTGVYIDGTGKFRIGTSTSGDNYIHFDGSTGLDIKTDTFNLNANSGDLLIDSSAKTISLGGATTFGTPGVFMSGSGGVSFFKDADNFFIMSGSIMDFTSQNLVVSSSTGTGATYKDLRIDTTVPQIRIQKDNSSGNENIIDIDGADGTIEVTVDGDLIFNSGEFENMKTTINRIINSAPTSTAPSTVNAPVTKVSNLKVSSNVDVDGTAFVDKGLLQQVTDNTTGFSTAFLSEINPVSYEPNVPGSSPVQQVFNVRKNIGTGTGAGKIVMQSAAFNTTIDAGAAAGVKFTDTGNTNLSSSLYQFQGILAQSDGGTSTGYFADGNACLISLDMDTQDIHSSVRQNFVYLQARRDIGAGLKTKFQVQGPDGAVASAGNITAFASSFNSVSDRRLKKDIYTISGSMDKILQLRPTEFTWIEQDKQDIGFIAQEVEEIIPEVIEMTDGFIDTETGEKSHENTKTIAYTKLIPYLVDTIQQMDKRIKELEERDN